LFKIFEIEGFRVDMVYGDEAGKLPPISECISFTKDLDYENLCESLVRHINMTKLHFKTKYGVFLDDKMLNLWFCFVHSTDPKDPERAHDVYATELFKEKGEWSALHGRGYITWGINWANEEIEGKMKRVEIFHSANQHEQQSVTPS